VLISVDLETPSVAFGLREDLRPCDFDWHSHNKHQLLYAAKGSMHLEVEDSQWLLPPQRAAWIGANVKHRVILKGEVELRTIYLPPSTVPLAPTLPCCVFAVNTMGREMILYSMRWQWDRDPNDSLANAYFSTLAGLVNDWTKSALPFHLPTAKSPELASAMEYALSHLEAPTLESAAQVAGLSSRTLTRRFIEEANTTWQQWIYMARMLRAMQLLSIQGTFVSEAARAVGYSSLGAFSKAFHAFTGETPSDFRRHT
jgi:AraC-like DNA-binding protein